MLLLMISAMWTNNLSAWSISKVGRKSGIDAIIARPLRDYNTILSFYDTKLLTNTYAVLFSIANYTAFSA